MCLWPLRNATKGSSKQRDVLELSKILTLCEPTFVLVFNTYFQLDFTFWKQTPFIFQLARTRLPALKHLWEDIHDRHFPIKSSTHRECNRKNSKYKQLHPYSRHRLPSKTNCFWSEKQARQRIIPHHRGYRWRGCRESKSVATGADSLPRSEWFRSVGSQKWRVQWAPRGYHTHLVVGRWHCLWLRTKRHDERKIDTKSLD